MGWQSEFKPNLKWIICTYPKNKFPILPLHTEISIV